MFSLRLLHVNNLVLVFFKIRVMYCKAFVYTPLLCSLVIFNVAFNPPPKDIVVLALSVGPKPFRPSVRPSVRNVYSVRMLILVMDFQILLSPAEYFEGDIVLALYVRLSSFRSSGRLWTTESWPKAHCEVTCLLPLIKWESCQLLTKIWIKHWLWHQGRSLKYWLPLKWPNSANNGVKPHTDKIKLVEDNRQ